ncbi:MAG: hypothetical protein ACI976_000663, partial [Aureispira sp.]
MKNSIIAFLACIFFLSPTFGQYNGSGGLLTINTGPGGSGGDNTLHKQDNSVGALGPSTLDEDRRPINYYAISSQYVSSSGNQCWRNIKFFKDQGTLLATSSIYSHDHIGKTKIIFDPNNGKVVYALYQERFSTTGSPAVFQTFVKRFEFNPNTNTITQSSRFHVFDFIAGADFVVAPNGDLLVGSPMPDNGQVHIKVIRYANGSFSHLNTFITSQVGEAYSVPLQEHTWPLSMDMKGSTIVIAHSKGDVINSSSIKIKTGTYIAPTVPNTGSLPLIHEYNFSGQRLHISGLTLHQAVGLRPNGDILYLMKEVNNSTNWKLIKIDPINYSTSPLMNGSGNAHLAVSENNMAFLAKVASGVYTIEKFNDYDVHEHTYTLAWQIDEGIKHLAVRDCKILSCGREEDYWQHHELYECSDCNGEKPTPNATFINQEYDIITSSIYGPQVVPVYCSWDDVMIDASASTCENSVRLSICEIDPSTWATSPNIFSTVVCTNCTAASDIQPADYGTLPTGYNSPYKYYLATIVVGPGWYPTYKLFKFDICKISSGGGAGEIRGKVSSNKTNNPVIIFPNPTTGLVNIQLTDVENNSNIQVVNSLGQVVLQKDVQGQITTEIDLSNYNSGLYLIQITTGEEQ